MFELLAAIVFLLLSGMGVRPGHPPMMWLVRIPVACAVCLAALWVGFRWSLREHGRDTWAMTALLLGGCTYALFILGD